MAFLRALTFFGALTFSSAEKHPMQSLANSGAAYPVSFPFKIGSESNVPGFSFEHDWTQNFTYEEESDNGGYRYNGYWAADMNDWQEHFTKYGSWTYKANNLPLQYLLVTKMNRADGTLPVQAWNCSNMVQEDGHFFGTANNVKVCNTGQCCSGYIGLPRRKDERDEAHLEIDGFLANGICGAIPEMLYCMLVNGKTPTSCIQSYTAPTGRIYPVPPCLDNFYLFAMSCKVYRSTGVPVTSATDPASYMSKCTSTDITLLNGVMHSPDKVCLPFNYYNPENSEGSQESTASFFVLTVIGLTAF